jgi:hypothetical protein
MPSPEESIRAELRRRAIVLEVGGFRPPDDPLASWFGRIAVGAPGEEWPVHNGSPMLPLCQINLTSLPFRPPHLDDMEMIAVFIGPAKLPIDKPNGDGWLLRTYKTLSGLVPIQGPDTRAAIRVFPMRPKVIEDDFPCWEDVPIEVPDEISNDFQDLYENTSGFKLGGWPSLLQGEIFWAPWNRHPAEPEYVFQIDSNEKAGWSWGDDGVGYFGRGTAAGKENEWTLSWQCL